MPEARGARLDTSLTSNLGGNKVRLFLDKLSNSVMLEVVAAVIALVNCSMVRRVAIKNTQRSFDMGTTSSSSDHHQSCSAPQHWGYPSPSPGSCWPPQSSDAGMWLWAPRAIAKLSSDFNSTTVWSWLSIIFVWSTTHPSTTHPSGQVVTQL